MRPNVQRQTLEGLLAALFLFLSVCRLDAATGDLHWSLLSVSPADRAALTSLRAAGLEVLKVEAGEARVLANPIERAWLAENGFAVRVEIEDYGLYLARRRQEAAQPHLAGAIGFAKGSMGGYFSPEEVAAFVDSLVRIDTHGIISPRFEIGRTHQNRPLWAVRVSENAAQEDPGKPRVLYNSLIHAREGVTGMCLLYYLGWLVENYGRVDSVTALVDSRELYFIPLVNPDGYEINWNSYKNSDGRSFGLWRKNVRDNDGDGAVGYYDGVDLNRNFSLGWGYDNQGSSPYWSSESYRGPEPFSEPETQAFRDFVNARGFSCAVNFHSYSSVLINPWGYVNAQTPDSLLYVRLGRELTAENRYVYGTAVGTLGYLVNGELTDWEYGDSAHSRIMAWSLEIGTTGDDFWPSVSRIESLCEQNLPFCYSLARLAGFNPRLDSLRVVYSGADSAQFGVGFRLTNRGYPSNPGPLGVRLESAETRLSLNVNALSLADLPLDSLVRVNPESLQGSFSGKLDRAALNVALYAGDTRIAVWPLAVSRSFTRYYDLDSSGRVDVFDLLALLRRLARGPSAGADDSLFDLNDDGRVDVFDLLALLRKL